MDIRGEEWDRLESIIEWANLNTNAFAKEIGLKRAENLYQIKRGSHGISRKLADRIVERYPEIDRVWILEGGNEMFSRAEMRGVRVPLYDVSVEQNIANYTSLKEQIYITIPPNVTADLAMPYRGRAMGDVTPVNTILLLKKELSDMIVAGSEYVIVTKKFTLLRRVRNNSSEISQTIRLQAGDSTHYDDVVVPLVEVVAAYRVTAKITICE